jgi:hypothetical protein
MSSTLFNVLFAWKCSSTHHKLALDALNHIRGDAADNWRNLCLANVETYLDGSKAPDNKFKDFTNHVLHVRDNHWGGAVKATQKWYTATVEALRAKKWSDAIYNAGVLSHYYTDPIQPFHTGQCEAEGIVHRAAEWSIACAYRELTDILEADLGGWPDVTVPAGDDWLAKMVVAGADLANPHYEVCIDHYDMKKGVKDPPTGLDQEIKDRIAKLIGHAVVGYARIMERAFTESQATPPATNITLLGLMAKLTIPIFWVTKKLKDAKERAIVEATFKEYEATGKVIDTLTEDDYTIRKAHCEEVLKKPLEELDAEEPKPIGTAHGIGAPARPRPMKNKLATPPAAPSGGRQSPGSAIETPPTSPSNPKSVPRTPPTLTPTKNQRTDVPRSETQTERPAEEHADRYYLNVDMPVEKAPSIGAKTAALLEDHGVRTVGNLLSTDPDKLAVSLNDRHLDSYTILMWQMQADLCCDVPNLRGHDAQFLTACGITHRGDLATAEPAALLKKVDSFVTTPAGERILRGSERPDLAEVTNWIRWANRPEQSKAA